MFSNKKQVETLENLKEDNQNIAHKTKSLQKDIKLQNDQIQKQQTFLDKMSKEQKQTIHNLQEEIETLKNTNDHAKAAVHNLNTVKIELKDNVTNKFQQQLTHSLKQMETCIDADTSKITELSHAMKDIIGELKKVKSTILQFQDLAATVKDTDFKLKEHAKALNKVSNEKVTLLKRIDELESMIAKHKRNGPHRGPRF